MLPNYIDEILRAYFQVSSEDRRVLLDERLFDDDPLTCDERYLPYYSAELGIKIDDLPLKKQREAVLNAIQSLTRAGTTSYLEENLKADIANEIVELGDYHFRVDLKPDDPNDRFDKVRIGGIDQRVESLKNVRSVFDGILFRLYPKERVNLNGGDHFGLYIDRNKNPNLPLKSRIENSQSGIVNSKLKKEVNRCMAFENQYNTKGVVVWQV